MVGVRRSRKELETLAARFVAGAPAVEQRRGRVPLVLGGVVLVMAAGGVAWWLSRPATTGPERAALPAAAAELESLQQRLAAERERNRAELEAGRRYLEKIGDEDSEALRERQQRAPALGERQDAAPEPASGTAAASAPARTPEPGSSAAGPREAPAASSAPKSASAAPPSPPATAPQTARAAPPKAAGPEADAQAGKTACNIHVSELSRSRKLTYDDIKRMKGARIAPGGHVYLPPVAVEGRDVVFVVAPSGCVRIVQSTLR